MLHPNEDFSESGSTTSSHASRKHERLHRLRSGLSVRPKAATRSLSSAHSAKPVSDNATRATNVALEPSLPSHIHGPKPHQNAQPPFESRFEDFVLFVNRQLFGLTEGVEQLSKKMEKLSERMTRMESQVLVLTKELDVTRQQTEDTHSTIFGHMNKVKRLEDKVHIVEKAQSSGVSDYFTMVLSWLLSLLASLSWSIAHLFKGIKWFFVRRAPSFDARVSTLPSIVVSAFSPSSRRPKTDSPSKEHRHPSSVPPSGAAATASDLGQHARHSKPAASSSHFASWGKSHATRHRRLSLSLFSEPQTSQFGTAKTSFAGVVDPMAAAAEASRIRAGEPTSPLEGLGSSKAALSNKSRSPSTGSSSSSLSPHLVGEEGNLEQMGAGVEDGGGGGRIAENPGGRRSRGLSEVGASGGRRGGGRGRNWAEEDRLGVRIMRARGYSHSDIPAPVAPAATCAKNPSFISTLTSPSPTQAEESSDSDEEYLST